MTHSVVGTAGPLGAGVVTDLSEVHGLRLLALVETPRTGAGFDVAAAVLRRGCTPIVLIQNPDGIDRFVIDTYLGMGAIVARCDTGTEAAIIRSYQDLGGRNEMAGLTCAYEYCMERSAEAARALGLPGPDPAAIRTCRSKPLLRAALEAAGSGGLNPRHALVRSPSEAEAAAHRLGLPVVVKPANLTGSVYVKRCDDPASAHGMATKILTMETYMGVPVEPVVLVEEYLNGPEFSVELLDGRSVGVTAKQTSPPPFFIELGHTYPAPASEEVLDRVRVAAETALAAAGLHVGPAHVEVKWAGAAGGRAVVIDANPRLAGGRIPELVRLAQGISLSTAQVDSLLGRPVDLVPTRRRTAVIRFLPTPAKGRLVRLEGIEEAAAVAGVEEVALEPEVDGDYFANGSNRDRVAHVIAVADDADLAHAVADEALGRLTVEWANIEGELRYP